MSLNIFSRLTTTVIVWCRVIESQLQVNTFSMRALAPILVGLDEINEELTIVFSVINGIGCTSVHIVLVYVLVYVLPTGLRWFKIDEYIVKYPFAISQMVKLEVNFGDED